MAAEITISLASGGERNTCYFHTSTLVRCRHNTISSLKDSTGHWQDDADQLRDMARDYFLTLYSTEPVLPCDSSSWTFPLLEPRDLLALNRAVSPEEVQAAFFQMGATKAPGPDGLPPLFYQRYWHLIGLAVTEFSLQIFTLGDLPA